MWRISWRLLFELIVCLGASVPPAMAQEWTSVTTRPIAYAEAELRQWDESSTADSRRTLLSQSVRIGPDGAFVAGRRVAGLEQIVETAAGRNRAWTSPPRPRTRRKSLGSWAIIPGLFLGGMLGGAVDCLVTRCGPGGAQIPTGVPIGMVVGALTAGFAPRQVAGGFLGFGAGAYAGAMVAGAIEGDCRSDHPCNTGAGIGASVGAIAGGLLGYRMAGQ